MRNTTLVYIENDNQYLMMLRNKKKIDENNGKWIGVGGKFNEGESPEECLIRETYEETGLTLTEYKFRGIVTFVSDEWGTEYMHLFTATKYHNKDGVYNSKEIPECDEGELKWIDKSDVMNLSLWEGDKAFLELLFEDAPFFTMRLQYEGDNLIKIDKKIY